MDNTTPIVIALEYSSSTADSHVPAVTAKESVPENMHLDGSDEKHHSVQGFTTIVPTEADEVGLTVATTVTAYSGEDFDFLGAFRSKGRNNSTLQAKAAETRDEAAKRKTNEEKAAKKEEDKAHKAEEKGSKKAHAE